MKRGCASRDEARMLNKGEPTAGPRDDAGIAARQHREQDGGKPLCSAVVCAHVRSDA